MALPTYSDIATKWGIDWCQHEGVWDRDEEGLLQYRRVCFTGPYNAHYPGFAEPSIGRVHYNDRLPTRRGIRNFLKLIAAIYHSHNRGQPDWLCVYEQNIWADDAARSLGIRFPLALSRRDKLFVISEIGGAPSGIRVYDDIINWAKEF